LAHLTKAITSNGAALSVGQSQHQNVDSDIALVIQTSGSTGSRKEVALSSSALVASALASNKFIGAKSGQRWSLLLPLTHIAGINVLIRSIGLGTEPIDLRTAKDKYPDADFTSIVPTQLYRAMTGNDNLLSHLKNAKAVLVGGAKLDSQLKRKAKELGINVVESYGMTETTGGCIYDGTPLENTSYELGKDNRIKISGSTLASGYLGEEKLWRESFDGKWFMTSDIGSVTNGLLEVASRVDDVVVSGGENVSLIAIESEIKLAFPDIDFAAFAVQDLEWGNAIHIAYAGANLSELEIKKLLENTLGGSAKPKEIHQLDRIPVTALGKVDKSALIEMVMKK
jgi:O-succinylbenzoic acid--CoA ligase